MLFSPQTQIGDKQEARESFLKKLMPELNKLYPGDPIELAKYPNLKSIIQLGHKSIRGVIKYKDTMVYANPRLTNLSIPENSPNDEVFDSYQGGRKSSSFTNREITGLA